MRLGIIGAGKVGAGLGRLLIEAGHDVLFSYARSPERLRELAQSLGARASAGSPADAVLFAETLLFAVPWRSVDDALAATGTVHGKVVIDATNQFGPVGLEYVAGMSAAAFNARRAPGASWVKAFNTPDIETQLTHAGRSDDERIGSFYAGDDEQAKNLVADLIEELGFAPIDLGGLGRNEVGHIEPKGELYGRTLPYMEALVLADKLRGTPPSGTGLP